MILIFIISLFLLVCWIIIPFINFFIYENKFIKKVGLKPRDIIKDYNRLKIFNKIHWMIKYLINDLNMEKSIFINDIFIKYISFLYLSKEEHEIVFNFLYN